MQSKETCKGSKDECKSTSSSFALLDKAAHLWSQAALPFTLLSNPLFRDFLESYVDASPLAPRNLFVRDKEYDVREREKRKSETFAEMTEYPCNYRNRFVDQR